MTGAGGGVTGVAVNVMSGCVFDIFTEGFGGSGKTLMRAVSFFGSGTGAGTGTAAAAGAGPRIGAGLGGRGTVDGGGGGTMRGAEGGTLSEVGGLGNGVLRVGGGDEVAAGGFSGPVSLLGEAIRTVSFFGSFG